VADSPQTTAASQEYLEWIYRLSKEQSTVQPLDLARALSVSSASVTAMLKRLVAGDLIERTQRGITLTPEGQQIAAGVVRRHTLLERLATDVLGIPWEKADEVACQLEHYVTDEVEERLAAFLGNPTTCPHGQRIDLESPDPSRPLCELGPGETAEVVRISDEDREFLSYLAALGVRPGVRLRVESLAPFNGPMTITIGESRHAIGREAASRVRVTIETQAETQ
jgi:DtxR family Mn-dependent transcriptional regulator